jgi:hypothetical protein
VEKLKYLGTPATNSMELSHFWEAVSLSATREIPSVLWNRKVHCCVHKNNQLVPILSRIDPVHTAPSCFSKVDFITAIRATSRSA